MMTPYQQWLGTANARPNFYELLGLDADEPSPPAVAAAASTRRAQLTSHPPGKQLDAWQAILREIDVAAQTLSDPGLRAEYDRYALGHGAAAANDAFLMRLTSAATAPSGPARATSASIRPAAAGGFDPMAPLGTAARPAPAPGVAPVAPATPYTAQPQAVPVASDSAKRRSPDVVDVSAISTKLRLETALNWDSTSRIAVCWTVLNAPKFLVGSPLPV